MRRIFKWVLIIPLYIIYVTEFLGGGSVKVKDCWEDLKNG